MPSGKRQMLLCPHPKPSYKAKKQPKQNSRSVTISKSHDTITPRYDIYCNIRHKKMHKDLEKVQSVLLKS